MGYLRDPKGGEGGLRPRSPPQETSAGPHETQKCEGEGAETVGWSWGEDGWTDKSDMFDRLTAKGRNGEGEGGWRWAWAGPFAYRFHGGEGASCHFSCLHETNAGWSGRGGVGRKKNEGTRAKQAGFLSEGAEVVGMEGGREGEEEKSRLTVVGQPRRH